MENFTIETLEARLEALPAYAVYAQLTGRESWGHKMQELIPSHMQDGLVRWIAYGRTDMLGGFMRAVLEGDLFNAYRRADSYNAAAIPDWVMFLINYAPAGCYGSPEQLEAWTGLINDE